MDLLREIPFSHHVNHDVVYRFYMQIGGEIYTRSPMSDDLFGLWVVGLDEVFFDENGRVKGLSPQIRKLSPRQFDNLLSPESAVVDQATSKFERLRSLYFSWIKATKISLLRSLGETLGFGQIEYPFEYYEDRVHLIRYQSQSRILRSYDPVEVRTKPEELILIHNYFSDLGISPRVYASGLVYPKDRTEPIVYVIMDHIPMTLSQIKDPDEQVYAVKEATKICYRIESLGYYDIDCHAGNFLYDSETRRVYAIDLAGLTKVYSSTGRFQGRIGDIHVKLE